MKILLCIWLVMTPQTTLTQAQATSRAQLIWGSGGWASHSASKGYQVGCTLNGKKRTEGTSKTSYDLAFAAINPANGVHNVTVTDQGITSNGKPFIVCY